MRLIDTNVILRYLMGDVPEQRQAAYAIFQRIAHGEEQAITLHTVVHEACYILSSSNHGYNLDHQDVKDRLLPLLTLDGLHIFPDKKLCFEALDIFAQGEKIDFTDALLVAYVRSGLADGIYTFEGRFDKIDGAHRIEP